MQGKKAGAAMWQGEKTGAAKGQALTAEELRKVDAYGELG